MSSAQATEIERIEAELATGKSNRPEPRRPSYLMRVECANGDGPACLSGKYDDDCMRQILYNCIINKWESSACYPSFHYPRRREMFGKAWWDDVDDINSWRCALSMPVVGGWTGVNDRDVTIMTSTLQHWFGGLESELEAAQMRVALLRIPDFKTDTTVYGDEGQRIYDSRIVNNVTAVKLVGQEWDTTVRQLLVAAWADREAWAVKEVQRIEDFKRERRRLQARLRRLKTQVLAAA